MNPVGDRFPSFDSIKQRPPLPIALGQSFHETSESCRILQSASRSHAVADGNKCLISSESMLRCGSSSSGSPGSPELRSTCLSSNVRRNRTRATWHILSLQTQVNANLAKKEEKLRRWMPEIAPQSLIQKSVISLTKSGRSFHSVPSVIRAMSIP